MTKVACKKMLLELVNQLPDGWNEEAKITWETYKTEDLMTMGVGYTIHDVTPYITIKIVGPTRSVRTDYPALSDA